ncbi:hypothetical protein GQX74_013119 [Glossina fuscipes]|nr:hypothetical protein GQX74_013119 [Glossina fuscipes]
MSDTNEFSDTDMEMIKQFKNCASDYESDSGSDIVVPVNWRLRVISDSSGSKDDLKNMIQSHMIKSSEENVEKIMDIGAEMLEYNITNKNTNTLTRPSPTRAQIMLLTAENSQVKPDDIAKTFSETFRSHIAVGHSPRLLDYNRIRLFNNLIGLTFLFFVWTTVHSSLPYFGCFGSSLMSQSLRGPGAMEGWPKLHINLMSPSAMLF